MFSSFNSSFRKQIDRRQLLRVGAVNCTVDVRLARQTRPGS